MIYFILAAIVLFLVAPSVVLTARLALWSAYERHGPSRILSSSKWSDDVIYWAFFPVFLAEIVGGPILVAFLVIKGMQ